MEFDNKPLKKNQNNWQHQLDKFVRANQTELAALAWGLNLEKGETDETIGIDLKGTPKFVYCSKAAIEKFNQNVDGKIQEILGLIDSYQPELEVLMIAIGDSQIKLVYFQPEISPPNSFEQLNQNVDGLLETLETRLNASIFLNLVE